jgi:trimethylamine--corrinoid protein Co-methyltransferase
MVGGWGLAGLEPGMNMSFSEAASGLMTTICNTDLGPGMGGLDSAKGCSLEQLVIDAYFWEDFRVFMKKIEITEESIAMDVVKSVGHGNSFLTHPHTAKNFRKELSFWDKKRLSWQKTLSNDMVDEARTIAKKLLKEHEVEQIDRDIVEQGDKILRDLEKSMIP